MELLRAIIEVFTGPSTEIWLEVVGITDFMKRFMCEIVFRMISEPVRKKRRNGWPGKVKQHVQRKGESPAPPCRWNEYT